MKQERKYPKASITSKAAAALKNGHPWVYADEVRSIDGVPADGCLIDCFEGNSWQGTGFYNSGSKIRIRIISRNANDQFDYAFWKRRISYSIRYRRDILPEQDFRCCRLIHGESDFIPGLTVDRYEDILSVQTACLGVELIKEDIYRALKESLEELGVAVSGIYERNDLLLREKEGLEVTKGWYHGFGTVPATAVTEITENGIRYLVDVAEGQKTGFFLDQKYNRAAAAKLAPGRRVLDCFTHTGSFGLNCALAGAEHVTSVDISQQAVDMAHENAVRNSLDTKMDFVCADVFDLLTGMAERKDRSYDYIILDPPAFTKSRQTVEAASRGYKEINLRAMKVLPRGGYLTTCSCSHFMTDELFKKMLVSAARDASVSLRLVEARGQAPDHPVLLSVPETQYLKCYIFQVV